MADKVEEELVEETGIMEENENKAADEDLSEDMAGEEVVKMRSLNKEQPEKELKGNTDYK